MQIFSKIFFKIFGIVKKMLLFCSMETMIFQVAGNKLYAQGDKTFLSKKDYAQKYGLSVQALAYLKHKKRVLTINILGAKFFEDKPPIKMRYQNLDK